MNYYRSFSTESVSSGDRSPRKPWSGLSSKADMLNAGAYFGSGPILLQNCLEEQSEP
jgi:hypothetical protein